MFRKAMAVCSGGCTTGGGGGGAPVMAVKAGTGAAAAASASALALASASLVEKVTKFKLTCFLDLLSQPNDHSENYQSGNRWTQTHFSAWAHAWTQAAWSQRFPLQLANKQCNPHKPRLHLCTLLLPHSIKPFTQHMDLRRNKRSFMTSTKKCHVPMQDAS